MPNVNAVDQAAGAVYCLTVEGSGADVGLAAAAAKQGRPVALDGPQLASSRPTSTQVLKELVQGEAAAVLSGLRQPHEPCPWRGSWLALWQHCSLPPSPGGRAPSLKAILPLVAKLVDERKDAAA